jgi:hypothetical protein
VIAGCEVGALGQVVVGGDGEQCGFGQQHRPDGEIRFGDGQRQDRQVDFGAA